MRRSDLGRACEYDDSLWPIRNVVLSVRTVKCFYTILRKSSVRGSVGCCGWGGDILHPHLISINDTAVVYIMNILTVLGWENVL